MTRPPLSERRRTHTRREIAESAVTLFARDGYDSASAGDTAGGGRPSGADPLPALPAGTDRQSGITCQ